MPVTVSNSTPLIHLAKLNQLALLPAFFGKIMIPQAVFNECVTAGEGYEDAALIAFNEKIYLAIKKSLDAI